MSTYKYAGLHLSSMSAQSCYIINSPRPRVAAHDYRDRVYIRRDILSKLLDHGELNQSKLMSYCGLNNAAHKGIVVDMADKGLIIRSEEKWGNKTVFMYRISEEGKKFLNDILDRYEQLFSRAE